MEEEIKNLAANFIKAKKREVSAATLNNYKFYLNRFFNLMDLTGPEKINYQAIRAFRLKLNQRKLSPATQNYHLIALRAFLKYLNAENVNNLDSKKISLYPVKKRIKQMISTKEIEKVLQAPEKEKIREIIRKRDKLLLELLFSSRLKVSEICRLKRKSLDDLNLGQQGKYWLKEYLKERKDNGPHLFVRHDRAGKKSDARPITPRSIQRIVASYAKQAGLKQKITPESFRNI